MSFFVVLGGLLFVASAVLIYIVGQSTYTIYRESRSPDGDGPWSRKAEKRGIVSGDVVPGRTGFGEGPVRVTATGLSRDDDGERDSDNLDRRNLVAPFQAGSEPADPHFIKRDWHEAERRAQIASFQQKAAKGFTKHKQGAA